MHFKGFRATTRAGLVAAGFCASLLASHATQAVSIGEITLDSQLGEPLRASVPLSHLGKVLPRELVVGQAGEADYRAYGMERPDFAGNLKFELVVDKRGTPKVEITTERPVSEPFLDVVLQVRWPAGHVVKQFTLLLDPPQK